jgi:hypothetical protein
MALLEQWTTSKMTILNKNLVQMTMKASSRNREQSSAMSNKTEKVKKKNKEEGGTNNNKSSKVETKKVREKESNKKAKTRIKAFNKDNSLKNKMMRENSKSSLRKCSPGTIKNTIRMMNPDMLMRGWTQTTGKR